MRKGSGRKTAYSAIMSRTWLLWALLRKQHYKIRGEYEEKEHVDHGLERHNYRSQSYDNDSRARVTTSRRK